MAWAPSPPLNSQTNFICLRTIKWFLTFWNTHRYFWKWNLEFLVFSFVFYLGFGPLWSPMHWIEPKWKRKPRDIFNWKFHRERSGRSWSALTSDVSRQKRSQYKNAIPSPINHPKINQKNKIEIFFETNFVEICRRRKKRKLSSFHSSFTFTSGTLIS